MPRGKGETVRKILLERGLLDRSLKVKRENGSILFPVNSEEARALGHEVLEEEFEARPLVETDYKRAVAIPAELKSVLPTSFDVIGDVAIIKLPDELLPFSKEIGEGLRKVFPRLRSIALDRGVKGELRVRDLEVIAGDESTETTCTEYGLKLLVDPAKTYFNPRLANERRRVASLVKQGEKVVDMFAGVGPFSIMIAKHAWPEIVYAIDLNKDAVEYMRKNIALNKVQRVVPIEGDARTVLLDLPCADRIIMNLPHSARDFFQDALTRLNIGGTIHFYHISAKEDVQRMLDKLIRDAKGMGVRVEMARKEELKTYSPSTSIYSIDLVLADWC